MNKVVNEFNNTANMCVDFILQVTNDTDLKFYKKAANKILMINRNKGIEQYIIYCLPYEKQVLDNDTKFFLNMKSGHFRTEKTNLFHILKLQKYFGVLDEEIKIIIFEYLKLLCNYSKEYLKMAL